MSTGGSGVGGRETVVTLVACALLGFEAMPSFLVGLVVLLDTGMPQHYLISGLVGIAGGCGLGLVLLRQGGVSVPSREEGGATRGALAGLAVGVLAMIFLGGSVGVLGTCALAGLAIGRTFDRPPADRVS